MPFTVAHVAAALPFRRLRLVPSALVIGSLAPDFEYFLRLAPDDGFGHTLLGIVVLTLPFAVLTLWMFHRFVKVPLAMLLPAGLQSRTKPHLHEFRFRGATRLALIISAVLLGIATHLVWDSFTHPATWLYRHWSVLGHSVRLPFVGVVPYYKAVQHGSTLVGMGILAAWFVRWYRTSEPAVQSGGELLSPARRMGIISVVIIVACAAAIIRACVGTGIPAGHLAFKKFVGQAVVTAMAVLWWELVAYGFLFRSKLPTDLVIERHP